MTQDKIKEVLDDSEYLTQEYTSEGTESHYKVNKVEAAKEIYKLHLEAQIRLLGSISISVEESIAKASLRSKIIELGTKLKELG